MLAEPTPPKTVERMNELKKAIISSAMVPIGLFIDTQPLRLNKMHHSLHFEIFLTVIR